MYFYFTVFREYTHELPVSTLLNQVHAGHRLVPGFLKLFHPRMLVSVCECVSTPKALITSGDMV